MNVNVNVPKELEALFKQAELRMSELFGNMKMDPSKGTIDVADERYILVRASSLSNDFFDCIVKLYEAQGIKKSFDFTRQLLFDISHAIGKKDAAYYR